MSCEQFSFLELRDSNSPNLGTSLNFGIVNYAFDIEKHFLFFLSLSLFIPLPLNIKLSSLEKNIFLCSTAIYSECLSSN